MFPLSWLHRSWDGGRVIKLKGTSCHSKIVLSLLVLYGDVVEVIHIGHLLLFMTRFVS